MKVWQLKRDAQQGLSNRRLRSPPQSCAENYFRNLRLLLTLTDKLNILKVYEIKFK